MDRFSEVDMKSRQLFSRLKSAQRHLDYLNKMSLHMPHATCVMAGSLEDIQDGLYIEVPHSILRLAAIDQAEKLKIEVSDMNRKAEAIKQIIMKEEEK